jgi:hypothetical protein
MQWHVCHTNQSDVGPNQSNNSDSKKLDVHRTVPRMYLTLIRRLTLISFTPGVQSLITPLPLLPRPWMWYQSIEDRLNFVLAAHKFVDFDSRKWHKFPKLICTILWNNLWHSVWLVTLERAVFLERASFLLESFVAPGIVGHADPRWTKDYLQLRSSRQRTNASAHVVEFF